MPKIEVDDTLCKKCGICEDVCPVDVYSFNELEGVEVTNPEDCTKCSLCIKLCPDFAITITEKEGAKR